MTMSFYPLILAFLIPPILFLMSWWLSNRPLTSINKLSPYECGFDPKNNARMPFSLRFFLLVVLFLVFDIEIVLLMPLPLTINLNPLASLITAASALTILILGLIHEWNEGSLNW
uniref:NADH-ubiquinone oxidoreductase chain 3 n=1 Tax=Sclerolinum brattstromi TaxID=167799 RepID=A0A0E3DR51_9ANNE|nr:NADH dehydrogenase subunit 3 [Sclerolinum brattstromi]AIL54781.1 NADH dehydrogenase subunit 3 [Sclerolinum brattstromi]